MIHVEDFLQSRLALIMYNYSSVIMTAKGIQQKPPLARYKFLQPMDIIYCRGSSTLICSMRTGQVVAS